MLNLFYVLIYYIFYYYVEWYLLLFTCYDGAPLRSPVLEKGVMLGVVPLQR
jgi:hypothetical protein